jgi:hypothetical protein
MKVFAILSLAGAAAAIKLAQGDDGAVIECDFWGEGESAAWACWNPVTYNSLGDCMVMDKDDGPMSASGPCD